jgi:hypothetical protein
MIRMDHPGHVAGALRVPRCPLRMKATTQTRSQRIHKSTGGAPDSATRAPIATCRSQNSASALEVSARWSPRATRSSQHHAPRGQRATAARQANSVHPARHARSFADALGVAACAVARPVALGHAAPGKVEQPRGRVGDSMGSPCGAATLACKFQVRALSRTSDAESGMRPTIDGAAQAESAAPRGLWCAGTLAGASAGTHLCEGTDDAVPLADRSR